MGKHAKHDSGTASQGWAEHAKAPACPRDNPSSGVKHPIAPLKPKRWPGASKKAYSG